MDDPGKLNDPWLVAVWPGMGNVAVSAGYYLMAKLGMHQLAEFSAHELFEMEFVEVEEGIIHAGRLPRSRFFVWHDPNGKHDLVVFLGEAQPPSGKYAFCRRLIEYARELGVRRIFTFAAMATAMHPHDMARVFVAATDEEGLRDLKRLDVEVLKEGQISGLNGVLLGVAAEHGIRGSCLLGEIPHLFSQIPFPKASLAVLEVFVSMAGVELHMGDLASEATAIEEKLSDLLDKMKEAIRQQQSGGTAESGAGPAGKEPPRKRSRLGDHERRRIEELFAAAASDRTRAYELKKELDRLEAFEAYEDRFLDLFKEPRQQGGE